MAGEFILHFLIWLNAAFAIINTIINKSKCKIVSIRLIGLRKL